MRWLLIYYVVGLIVELAAAVIPGRWDRKKQGIDSLMQDHGAEPVTESSYTALVFIMVPVAALFWPIGVAFKIFPRLLPDSVRKYTDK